MLIDFVLPNSRLESHEAEEADTALREREGETHAWHLPGDAAANSKRRRVYPRARKQSLWNSHRKVDELV